MIGSNFADKTQVCPGSTREYFSRREQIKKPDRTQLNKPDFRNFIKAIFTVENRDDLNQVRAEIIANVRKLGTVDQLNGIFSEIRQAGVRPWFPAGEKGKVDYTMFNQDTGVLGWVIHDDASETPFDGESTSWVIRDYELDSDTGRWLPKMVKERNEAKQR